MREVRPLVHQGRGERTKILARGEIITKMDHIYSLRQSSVPSNDHVMNGGEGFGPGDCNERI